MNDFQLAMQVHDLNNQLNEAKTLMLHYLITKALQEGRDPSTAIPSCPYEYGKIVLDLDPSYYKYLDPDVILHLIDLLPSNNGALRYIPNPTPEICEKFLRSSAWNYEHIPENLKTYEMPLYAASRNVTMMCCIPKEHLTMELCREAIKCDVRAMYSIPELSEELLMEAYALDPIAICFFNSPSEEMCIDAITRNPKSFEYLRSPSDEVIMFALQKDPSNIECIVRFSEKVKQFVLDNLSPSRWFCIGDLPLDIIEPHLDEHGSLIDCIQEPTLEHFLRAVRTWPDAVYNGFLEDYAENPAHSDTVHEIFKIALTHGLDYMVEICGITESYKPPEELIHYFIEQYDESNPTYMDGTYLDYSHEMMRYILDHGKYSLFEYAVSIPEDISHELIEKSPESALQWCKNLTDSMRARACEVSTSCVRFLNRSHENWSDICIKALLKDWTVIYHIKKPTDVMCYLAILLNPMAARLIGPGYQDHDCDAYHEALYLIETNC